MLEKTRRRQAQFPFSTSHYLQRAHGQATELDPTYAKGWARLATAEEETGFWDTAIETWQCAIDAFPKGSELSATDKKQRDLYEQNLKKAQATLKRKQEELESLASVMNISEQKAPWHRAEEMRGELERSDTPNSSVSLSRQP